MTRVVIIALVLLMTPSSAVAVGSKAQATDAAGVGAASRLRSKSSSTFNILGYARSRLGQLLGTNTASEHSSVSGAPAWSSSTTKESSTNEDVAEMLRALRSDVAELKKQQEIRLNHNSAQQERVPQATTWQADAPSETNATLTRTSANDQAQAQATAAMPAHGGIPPTNYFLKEPVEASNAQAVLKQVREGHVHAPERSSPDGIPAFLSEDGFQIVAALHSDDAMKAYVRRVIETMGKTVKDEDAFAKFVGTLGVGASNQHLVTLTQELNTAPWIWDRLGFGHHESNALAASTLPTSPAVQAVDAAPAPAPGNSIFPGLASQGAPQVAPQSSAAAPQAEIAAMRPHDQLQKTLESLNGPGANKTVPGGSKAETSHAAGRENVHEQVESVGGKPNKASAGEKQVQAEAAPHAKDVPREKVVPRVDNVEETPAKVQVVGDFGVGEVNHSAAEENSSRYKLQAKDERSVPAKQPDSLLKPRQQQQLNRHSQDSLQANRKKNRRAMRRLRQQTQMRQRRRNETTQPEKTSIESKTTPERPFPQSVPSQMNSKSSLYTAASLEPKTIASTEALESHRVPETPNRAAGVHPTPSDPKAAPQKLPEPEVVSQAENAKVSPQRDPSADADRHSGKPTQTTVSGKQETTVLGNVFENVHAPGIPGSTNQTMREVAPRGTTENAKDVSAHRASADAGKQHSEHTQGAVEEKAAESHSANSRRRRSAGQIDNWLQAEVQERRKQRQHGHEDHEEKEKAQPEHEKEKTQPEHEKEQPQSEESHRGSKSEFSSLSMASTRPSSKAAPVNLAERLPWEAVGSASKSGATEEGAAPATTTDGAELNAALAKDEKSVPAKQPDSPLKPRQQQPQQQQLNRRSQDLLQANRKKNRRAMRKLRQQTQIWQRRRDEKTQPGKAMVESKTTSERPFPQLVPSLMNSKPSLYTTASLQPKAVVPTEALGSNRVPGTPNRDAGVHATHSDQRAALQNLPEPEVAPQAENAKVSPQRDPSAVADTNSGKPAQTIVSGKQETTVPGNVFENVPASEILGSENQTLREVALRGTIEHPKEVSWHPASADAGKQYSEHTQGAVEEKAAERHSASSRTRRSAEKKDNWLQAEVQERRKQRQQGNEDHEGKEKAQPEHEKKMQPDHEKEQPQPEEKHRGSKPEPSSSPVASTRPSSKAAPVNLAERLPREAMGSASKSGATEEGAAPATTTDAAELNAALASLTADLDPVVANVSPKLVKQALHAQSMRNYPETLWWVQKMESDHI